MEKCSERSDLFSIGEFARLAGVTVKALKYYEKKKILKPAWTDPGNGYRYYSLHQVRQLELIGVFVDLDICLNMFDNYVKDDFQSVHYKELLQVGKTLTQKRIQTLENKMRYIDYLEKRDKDSGYRSYSDSYPVWLQPCEKEPDKINIEKAMKKILHDITAYGLTFCQSYGLIMICNGNEKRVYYFADINDSHKTPVIHENIFYIPKGDYRSTEQNEQSILMAPEIFKDLFKLPYDKVIIERELTYNSDRPVYVLSCLLPSKL